MLGGNPLRSASFLRKLLDMIKLPYLLLVHRLSHMPNIRYINSYESSHQDLQDFLSRKRSSVLLLNDVFGYKRYLKSRVFSSLTYKKFYSLSPDLPPFARRK